MKELKIGETVAFKCVEVKGRGITCRSCALYDGCTVDGDILGPCVMSVREDGKNIIFVRADLNEIIREKIVEAVDRISGNNDDNLLSLQSSGKECMIGFKASYLKRVLLKMLQVENEE